MIHAHENSNASSMPLGPPADPPRSSPRLWCGARPRTTATHSGKPGCVRRCGARVGIFTTGARDGTDAFLCARAHARAHAHARHGATRSAAARQPSSGIGAWRLDRSEWHRTHRRTGSGAVEGRPARAREARVERRGVGQQRSRSPSELGRFSVRRRPTRPPQRPRRHCQRRCRRRCRRRHPRRRSRLRRHQRPRIMIVSRIKDVFVSARTRNCGCRCTGAARNLCAPHGT